MAAERQTLDQLTARRKLLNGLYAGTFWKHVASGGIYRINSISMREADLAGIMNYTPVTHPDMEFNRPLDELLEIVATDGVPHTRFARVDAVVTYVG